MYLHIHPRVNQSCAPLAVEEDAFEPTHSAFASRDGSVSGLGGVMLLHIFFVRTVIFLNSTLLRRKTDSITNAFGLVIELG